MKLIKVFSDGPFKNVHFNEGYNIILATIIDHTNKKDTHNLGKTSLLVVIDFLLLGKYSKNFPVLSNPIFKGQSFGLEIKLNNGKYLVIRRSIDTSSKISFKLNVSPLADFSFPDEWDYEKLPFESAKKQLDIYLGYDILHKWSYRQSISYFLRTQKDYLDVFQLSKFKGKHILWKPFVFELLGFDGTLIEEKLKIDSDISKKNNEIQVLKQQASIDVAERDKIIGLIDIKAREKDQTESEIDKFDFYTQDDKTTRDLIDTLDTDLQILNSERYRVGHEIKKINASLKQVPSAIRLEKLKELYNDVNIYFPDALSKQYEELEVFTDAISNERRKYLQTRLTSLKDQYTKLDDTIKDKEKERSSKITLLTEADVYDKFKSYQKNLASLEAELKLLEEKLRLIDKSSVIKTKIEQLIDERKQMIASVKDAIDRRAHAEINMIFNQLITEVTGTNAVISIKLNEEGNVDFEADYLTTSQMITSEAEGMTYKKLLCVAFDLALLVFYSKQSFCRFVYHDGVLEGLDNRVKQRLITATQRVCEDNGLQYIISLIDSDIPETTSETSFVFPSETICLRLSDKDDKSKLFERSF